MLCSFLHLGLANWRRFAAIVTVPVTRTVGFAGSAEPSGTQAANTGLCFAAYELQERTLAPWELVTQLRAQVRKASMMWQGSIWTSWQRDLVEIKIFFFFPSRNIEFSFSIMIFLVSFSFSVRKCQSKDNYKSSKLFSDASTCSQLNNGMYTWPHLHRNQPGKPPERVGLELLEPSWLLTVQGRACVVMPAGMQLLLKSGT